MNENTKACIDSYVKEGYVKNILVRVGNRAGIICDSCHFENNSHNSTTLFDMASVTKIMATTTLTLIAIDKKLLCIDDPVSKFFNTPDDKKTLTVKNLLTHTMGIGHKPLNIEGNNYENIQNYILSLPSDVKIGSEVLYSCPGYILLGKIIEKVLGDRLDKLFLQYIAKPLDLKNTSFLPPKNHGFVNSNLKDSEIGIVNDYNCKFLGGVAGNAGLFSNIDDICKYINMLENYGKPLITRETFNSAIKNYTINMSESRGLGFLYVDKKYKQTGKLFPEGSIGHCGHTGQSLFVDLKSGFYTVILSDATLSVQEKYDYDKYEIVMKMREEIHNALYKDLKKRG